MNHIITKSMEKEEAMIRRKEEKLKNMYHTLERNTYITEKRK